MFTDIHAHVFTMKHVPDKFLGIKLSFSDRFLNWISNTFSWIIPGSKDQLENIASFTKHLGQTVEQNFLDLISYYPENSKVCLLLMDMREINGKIEENYQIQINEMIDLKKKYPDKILLFLHLDPNQAEMSKLFEEYVKSNTFDGVKVYPPLNSKPTDNRFVSIWHECEKSQIPIITHCGAFGVSASNFFNFSKGEYAHPKYWREVLKAFPELRLDLAHFGEMDTSWQKEIMSLCETYENVYTDTSFIIGSALAVKQLAKCCYSSSILNSKLLYGSDFYMLDLLCYRIKDDLNYLRENLGENLFYNISEVNPKNFLNSK